MLPKANRTTAVMMVMMMIFDVVVLVVVMVVSVLEAMLLQDDGNGHVCAVVMLETQWSFQSPPLICANVGSPNPIQTPLGVDTHRRAVVKKQRHCDVKTYFPEWQVVPFSCIAGMSPSQITKCDSSPRQTLCRYCPCSCYSTIKVRAKCGRKSHHHATRHKRNFVGTRMELRG